MLWRLPWLSQKCLCLKNSIISYIIWKKLQVESNFEYLFWFFQLHKPEGNSNKYSKSKSMSYHGHLSNFVQILVTVLIYNCDFRWWIYGIQQRSLFVWAWDGWQKLFYGLLPKREQMFSTKDQFGQHNGFVLSGSAKFVFNVLSSSSIWTCRILNFEYRIFVVVLYRQA